MNEKKKRIRFNILDVVVVLLVAVLIVAYVLRSNLFNSALAVTESVDMEVSVKMEDVRIYTIEAFEIGENIYDRETGNLLGKITEINYEPSRKTVELDGSQTEDGLAKAVLLENPGKYDLYITFEASGKVSDEGAYINGNKLVAPNSGLSVSTRKVMTEGKIVSVNENADLLGGGENE